jgi:hypothetical protein
MIGELERISKQSAWPNGGAVPKLARDTEATHETARISRVPTEFGTEYVSNVGMEHYRYDSLFHKYSVVVFIIGN